ncbi:hypothetical protein ENKO_362 [Klebsiella phage fENko-Kae01]|nr:hypothetical protein [Klebsiella phage fENko-Kae01]
MTKQKVVVFDCDEILLDHLGGLREYVKDHFDIVTKTEYPTEYCLEEWLGLDAVQVQEVIKQFNQTAYEFGLLKPLEGAQSLLCALRHTYPDVVFAVLTKSGTFGHGEVLRHVNIHNVYPNIFDEIHIVEMYESKRGVLSKLKQQYDVVCLVDDYIMNIETALALEIPGIMLKRPHNEKYKVRTDFTFVENWAGIIHSVITLMNKGE